MIFEGDTISPIGIRYNYKVGAWVGCVDGDIWFEPSGRKICISFLQRLKSIER